MPWGVVLALAGLGFVIALVGSVYPLVALRGASAVRALRGEQYAAQWLSGRWAGKQLLATLLGLPLADLVRLHIQSRDGRDRGCRH